MGVIIDKKNISVMAVLNTVPTDHIWLPGVDQGGREWHGRILEKFHMQA